jgi:hypothetical protein
MFRHGNRSPIKIYNNTDFLGKKWSNGGELTPAGRRLQFLLGLRNRKVYEKFMDKTKIDGSIYIKSSDYNRTIESVQSQMHGFFPPGTAEKIRNLKAKKLAHPFIDAPENEDWDTLGKKYGLDAIQYGIETFPIHIFSRNDPYYQFLYDYTACNLKHIYEENRKKPQIQEFLKNFEEKYAEKLAKMTNQTIEKFMEFNFLLGFMDSFISDIYDGRDLSKFENFGIDLKIFNNTVFEFSRIFILDIVNGDEEAFVARWAISMFWPEVISFMERRIEADLNKNFEYKDYILPKFVFFSLHDDNIGSALTVLNRAFGFKKFYTPFGANLFFELNENSNKEYSVSIKYQSLLLGNVLFKDFKEKLESQFLTKKQIKDRCGF